MKSSQLTRQPGKRVWEVGVCSESVLYPLGSSEKPSLAEPLLGVQSPVSQSLSDMSVVANLASSLLDLSHMLEHLSVSSS